MTKTPSKAEEKSGESGQTDTTAATTSTKSFKTRVSSAWRWTGLTSRKLKTMFK